MVQRIPHSPGGGGGGALLGSFQGVGLYSVSEILKMKALIIQFFPSALN